MSRVGIEVAVKLVNERIKDPGAAVKKMTAMQAT